MARYIQQPQQQYVSQYVPKDLNFYQQQIDKAQNRYDTTQAMYSEALGALGEMEAYDQDTKNEIIKGFVEDFDKTYNKYQGDLSKATGDVMGLVSKTRANPLLAGLKEQLVQGRTLEKQLAANPNLIVINDPRTKSVKDLGSFTELQPVTINPREVNALFLDMNKAKLNKAVESAPKKDPITGLFYTETTKGLTDAEITEMLQDENTYNSIIEQFPQLAGRENDPFVQQTVRSIVAQSASQFKQGVTKSPFFQGAVTTPEDKEGSNLSSNITFNTPMEGIVVAAQQTFDTGKLLKTGRTTVEAPWVLSPSATSSINVTKKATTQPATYGILSKEETEIMNNIASNIFQIKDKNKLEDYTDKEISNIKTFLDNALSAKSVSTYVSTIPNSNTYGINTTGKSNIGALGLTNYIFGDTKIGKDSSPTGFYTNLHFYDLETKKVYKGRDFYEKVLKKLPEDTDILIPAELSVENPYPVITGDYKFSKAYQVNAGNKTFIMSSPESLEVNGINVMPSYEAFNKISNAQYSTPGVPISMDLPLMDGNKAVRFPSKITWDGQTYNIEMKLGNDTFTGKGHTAQDAYYSLFD